MYHEIYPVTTKAHKKRNQKINCNDYYNQLRQTYSLYLEYVTKNVDEGAPVDAICIDFSKVIDSVFHERLLMEM